MSSTTVLAPASAPDTHMLEVPTPRERTGQLLKQTRAQRNALLQALTDIQDAASRHHRGDPYGTQGAAAQEILDLVAASRRRLRELSGS